MSEHTLTPCHNCQRGYRARDMYEEEVYEECGKTVLLCEDCFRKWCAECDEALREVEW